MTEPELAELETYAADHSGKIVYLQDAAPALLAHIRFLQGLIRDIQEERGYLPSIEQARRDEREACARLVTYIAPHVREWCGPIAAEGVARIMEAIAAEVRERQ